MFSKPDSGWCKFSIKDFYFWFSYIRDTPKDFINQLKNSMDNRCTFSINLDGETEFCLLVCDRYTLYIISDSLIDYRMHTKPYLSIYEINMVEFVQEFIDDMKKYEYEWSRWMEHLDESRPEIYRLEDLQKSLERYTG